MRLRETETIPARVVDVDEKQQVEWIIKAALIRRHLSDDQRSILAARFREPLKEANKKDRATKGGKTGGVGREKPVGPRGPQAKQKPSRTVVAEQFNVSEKRVRAATELQAKSPEIADKVLSGEMTLPQARQVVNRAEKREQLEAKAKDAPDEPQDVPSYGRWRRRA